ncbi:MAG: myxosortase-dependent M36 family metallopeptidase [Hyalangium sp.]|uniref:myxosortase-dependent M36 family metallopeptidase n=1 Tax=Hyalangium sp. TaxID=2028555 RepID=UPI00389AF2B9
MRLKDKLLTSLLLVPLAGTSAWAKDHVNFDAFLVNHEAKSLAADEASLQSRGVRVDQVEERLGLPTVLWNDRHDTERTNALATQRPEQAARTHLQKFADIYRLTTDDVSSASLQSVHQTQFGPVIARFGQKVGGVEVFRSGVNVVMDRENNLVAITGYLTPHEAVAARLSTVSTDFQLSPADAIARAFKDLTDTAISGRSLAATGTQGDYTQFDFAPGVSAVLPHTMAAPARAKKVYFTLPGGLQPAYYVELAVGTKSTKDSDYYSFVVSATDGSLLFRNNLTAEDSYSYRVWADTASYIPFDGPQGTDASPHPTGVPDHYQAPFLPANLLTLQNVPFSRNDPWLPPNATKTTGNNVDAYADLGAPDGYQPESDLRPGNTAPGAFDYTYDVTKSPSTSLNQRKAAIVHLFYLNNFLHDWYYDFGFDEISGNAQANNYGRGGLDNDSIKAEAQDYSGRNNANMSTPADGSRPRMQMYVFDGVPALTVLSPASQAGNKEAGSASFGATVFDVTGPVSILNTSGITDGCAAFAPGTFTGKIALIDRGTCTFVVKAKNAQDAGAAAVIIANNAANQPAPGLGGTDATITVPTLSITQELGNAWKAEVKNNGTTITANMKKTADLDRDGTIDNTIVAHEWGHYISNRLIGNSNGLTNNQGRSMGEGWADFHAMLMVVKDEDRTKPGNNLFQGVYALAGYVESGGGNNGYYYGIRRVPYSTDLTRDPLTFKHFANGNPLPATAPISFGQTGTGNSEVHNGGEVWSTMLWECYASLLNAYPFQEAQNRMKSYLLAAYKATPNAPTLLEARDAVLAAAAASDPADYTRFVNAFAKRGAGFGAKAPNRDSVDHVGVVESFVNANNLEVVSIRLDDSVVGCDQDGVLDVGETGLLTVKVRNNGLGNLSAFTGTVSASGLTATVQFPNGNTLSFPAIPNGGTATATVQVKLLAVTGATPGTGMTITFNEPTLPNSAKTAIYDVRVHYDEALSVSNIDRFDAQMTSWTSGLIGSTAGWTPATELNTNGTTNRFIHVPDLGTISDVVYTTPWMQVNPSGNTTMAFKYRHSLESAVGGAGMAAPWFDGVVVELSLDDITWYDLFNDLGINPGYTDYLAVGDNPLSDRPAFVGQNAAFPGWSAKTVNFGTLLDGLPIRLRFRIASDSSAGAYGFDLDDVQFTNVTPAPFSNLVPETSDGTVCNRRPVADVGQSPRTVPEYDAAGNHTVVTLNGTASYDPDGQPLTYTWTQTAGDPVVLSDIHSPTPTFTVDVPYDSSFVFQLVVNDGVENSQPKTAIIIVPNTNHAPVAVATAPATVPERSTATLDGSGSNDADGEPLTYAWTQVGGPAVTLSSTTASKPSFATPEVSVDTTFTFALVVNDGYQDSTPATVSLKVANVDRLPTANAGADQTVNGRTLVALPGTGSDPDGDPLSYAWTQVAGDPVTVTLVGANTDTARFTSPDVKTATVLHFQLTVTPSTGASASDTVDITVRPDQGPSVNAGVDLFVDGRKTVTLYGSASDPENDAITYAWTQVDGPVVVLSGADTANPTFVSPDVAADAVLHFQLTVTADGLSASDTVAVTVRADHAPVANAGADQTVAIGATVVLSGFGSDVDGDAITYAWTQVGTPAVTLTGANTANASFTAPAVTTDTVLHFTLTVTANGKTTTDTVDVTVRAPVDHDPVANAGADQTVAIGATVALSGFGSDVDGDAITYAWTQVGTPAVTLTGANTANPTFTAPAVTANTVLHFTLTVTAKGKTATDTVDVTVRANIDHAPTVNAGPDLMVDGRKSVTLFGSASDVDGDTITYAWTQVDGPAVTLSGANTANATFTSPDVKTDAVLHFLLTVTANGLTATDTVAVTVRADHAPVANAGADLSVAVGASVTLSGFGSDVDGDAVSYAWTQVGTPAVTLTGANTANASFTAPAVTTDTVLHFTLTVTANGLTATDTVDVTVRANIDHAPVANAGADRTVGARETVTLQGFGSDPDGDAVTYAWSQLSGPNVTLVGATSATPSFEAPSVKDTTVLRFQLTVTANGKTATDTVDITVQKVNRHPVGHGPNALEQPENTSVTLDATQSSDPDGDAINYHWVQTGGPAVQLTGQDTAQLQFTTPEVREDTQVAFTLVVTDTDGATSEPVTVSVKVLNVNKAPAAQARHVAGGVSGETVTLDALGSTDPDGEKLTYKWEQTDGPEVSLSSATEPTVTFQAPSTTSNVTLAFKVTVTDTHGATASQTVNVEVTPAKDTGNSGGGCTTTGNSGGGAMLLALLAGVALSRRRLALR